MNLTPDTFRTVMGHFVTGVTVVTAFDAAIASLECTVVETFSAGDHDLLIGRVDALATEATEGEPLLYYRRRYLRIERATSATVEGKHDV